MDAFEIPTLETERLRLRPFRASDFDDYAALNADPEVVRHLAGAGGPWDRGRSWRHLAFLWGTGSSRAAACGPWSRRRPARSSAWSASPSRRAGRASSWPGVLARRWWGNGYATEAARAALDHAFTVLKKDRVISLIHPENRASIRVVERLGETPARPHRSLRQRDAVLQRAGPGPIAMPRAHRA